MYGIQYPNVEVGSSALRMDMTVTDAAESSLSLYNMADRGHKVLLNKVIVTWLQRRMKVSLRVA
jgi:hypothetical protein